MEKDKSVQYILISAGIKFRNKGLFSVVYRYIPAHFEHWYKHKSKSLFWYRFVLIIYHTRLINVYAIVRHKLQTIALM
jgi:hypothetical protein